MFTGLIEDCGTIVSRGTVTLGIRTHFEDIGPGESIAVDGVCLTVTGITRETGGSLIEFDFSPETSSRTTLSGLKKGGRVNLERALKLGDRMGGHMVSGHVDCVAKVLSAKKNGGFHAFRFSLPETIAGYVVLKGSIAVDGISLTVSKLDGASFEASVIPHTFDSTNLKHKKTGSYVNLEADMAAKYADKAKKSSVNDGNLKKLLFDSGFIE
ncbi:MAG: riboflavin synthase [Endomicrobiales bacterium]|nr:riboflavin synthase [Endomicrobiales bacterium]